MDVDGSSVPALPVSVGVVKSIRFCTFVWGLFTCQWLEAGWLVAVGALFTPKCICMSVYVIRMDSLLQNEIDWA